MIVKNRVSDIGFDTEIIDNDQRSSATLKMMQETRIDGMIVAGIKTEQFLSMIAQPGIK